MISVYDKLIELRNEKREKHIFPEFVQYPLLTTQGYDSKYLKDELNRLFKEGYIKVHRGINNQMIEIIKEYEDKSCSH